MSEASRTGRRGSSMVGAGILLSRLAGLAREATIARFIGVGAIGDALTAATKIPNVLQNLLGEGALSASFIPVYARMLSEGREKDAGKVAGAIAGLLAAVAGALVVVGVIFAEPITAVIAPGFTGDTFDLAVRLVRIVTPGVGFLVLSAWCLGILNSHRRFFLSYVAPVLWNTTQIAVLFFFGLRGLARTDLAVALGWAMFAGGILQFAVQVPLVLRLARGLRPSLDVGIPGVRRVLRNFAPVVAGRGAVQLLAFVEVMLASLLANGALIIIGYATRLYLLPISLFGMSVAAAALPDLSDVDAGDRDRLRGMLAPGLARIAFFVAPSAVAFFIAGDFIVATIFQRGAFSRLDTIAVWMTLAASSVGLMANTSSRLLQSALYGAGDTKSPAIYSVLRLSLAAAVGAFLMFQFDRLVLTSSGISLPEAASLPAFTPLPVDVRQAAGDGLLRLGAVGLTLAAGMSSWLEYALLRRRVHRLFGVRTRAGGGQLRPVVIALVPMAVVGLAARLVLDTTPTLLAGPAIAALMGLVYIGVAMALGIDEARALWEPVRRRLRR